MTLDRIAGRLQAEILWGEYLERIEIQPVWGSGLMSDVIAHAGQGDLRVTLQIRANTAAASAMKELARVVPIGGREPEAETLRKAQARRVPLPVTGLSAFEPVGRVVIG